jgi:hypothetical protein
MKNLLPKIALMSTLALAVPFAVNADTMDLNVQPATESGAPVRIDGVQADRPEGTYELFNYPRKVTVSFTNLNPSAARNVVFGMRGPDGSLVSSFSAAGTFAQGVSIRHDFTVAGVERRQQLARQEVDVEQATFADGTTWNNGQANPLSRRQSVSANL